MTSRRQFMALAGAGTLCSIAWAARGFIPPPRSVTVPLTLGTFELDLAGTIVTTQGYNGKVPGPVIRLTEGDVLRVPVTNGIDEPTLVHWHGISLVNPMDGTLLTQDVIAPGALFNYEFVVPEAGTHWYHSHYGAQADFGMYGPLIIDPRREDLSYDYEYTLVLDDWGDGVPKAPVIAVGTGAKGARFGGYGNFNRTGHNWTTPEPAVSFGGRAYPFILVNGKPPQDPAVFNVRRGDRVRLRIINAAADTAFRFALDGHPLIVTHADGMPVDPVTVDALRIGMAERYDVIVEARSPGIAQIGLLPEGKSGFGRALFRYVDAAASAVPPADARPAQLNGRLLTYDDLVGRFPAKVPPGSTPDKVFTMTLHPTSVEIHELEKSEPIVVSKGDIVRFNIRNESDNWHPMHLHGHHFHLGNAGRALKDTAVVPSRGGEITWDWKADNPGRWMLHCHNLYHHKDGMVRAILYDTELADYYNMPEGFQLSDLCI
jgi:FtsP/CotA-like multicopper oxidase with cupredoxin domain